MSYSGGLNTDVVQTLEQKSRRDGTLDMRIETDYSPMN